MECILDHAVHQLTSADLWKVTVMLMMIVWRDLFAESTIVHRHLVHHMIAARRVMSEIFLTDEKMHQSLLEQK